MSPLRYELGFYILEDDILHSHRHGNFILCNERPLFTILLEFSQRKLWLL
jgi:hypothetical protein